MPPSDKTAELYRMETPEHLCPYGLKSKDLLRRHGYRVIDHPLRTRAETDAFLREAGVETSPQTYFGGERIGGYDDLRVWLGLDPPAEERSDTSYRPVVVIFAVAALLALALSWHHYGNPLTLRALEWFVSLSMVLLALQKLQDVEAFSLMFLNYDLLARRWVPYASIYPYLEAGAGILMTAGLALWLAAPVSLVIGVIGAVSVAKAVWIDKRELKCACVGGPSKVPLGFVSFTESALMAGMGLWMGAKVFL